MSDEDRQWSAPQTSAPPASAGSPPDSPGTSELRPSAAPTSAPAGSTERLPAAGPFPPSFQGSPATTAPLPGHPQHTTGPATGALPTGPQRLAPGTPTWPTTPMTHQTGAFPTTGAPGPGSTTAAFPAVAAPASGLPANGAGYSTHPANGAGQPGYSTQPASGPGYSTQPASGPGYSTQPASGPGYGGQPASGPGYGGYTGQHAINGHPVSGQPGYNGQTGHLGQPGYGGPPGYPPGPGQPGYSQAQPVRGGRVAGLIVAAVVIAVVSAFGGGLVATTVADGKDGPTTVITRNAAPNLERSSVGAVAEKVLPSVVDITTGEGEGSGVIMTTDGTIITNNHVVAGATKLTVTFSTGKTATATVVGTDPAGDIAVIKAQNVSGLTAAKFGDSDAMRVGDTVLAVGSPLGLQGSVTAGIVSALHRTISSGEQGAKSIADAIQTDAAINPGNSGGALVNLAGEVVGINTAILTAGENSNGNIGVGFAISANRARAAADQLAKGGKVSHPYLGVQLTDGANGALIGGVITGGPADKAGIKNGDLVTKIGTTDINGATDLINAVQAGKAGDQVKMTIKRDNAEQQVTVTLGESP